ncbi:MAG: transposase [bacterium]
MGLRRIYNTRENTAFFITTTITRFARVFVEDRYCNLLIQSIRQYQQRYKFLTLGFVVMPSHFHWIIVPDLMRGSISDIMRDIKKDTAWRVFEQLENDGHSELLRLFEFEGKNVRGQDRKFWMRRFDDVMIRDDLMLKQTLEYIHYNPVKAGMVDDPEDYRYSSARNYIVGDHSVLDVITDWW